MRKRLSKKQKLANKRVYDTIRKGYKRTNGVTIEGRKLTYKQFKNRVKLRMEIEGSSAKAAVKKELNTETFVDAAERSRENLIQSLKTDFKEEYKQLRYLSREKGKLKSLKENLTWDKDRGGYVVGGKYFIDVTNSPEEVNIYEIN